MPQIKITLTDEEINLLQARADKNLNSMSKEARVILHHALYNTLVEPITPIPGVPFPEIPSIITSTAQVQPQSFAHANTTTITSTPTSHTHADITPPGVQSTTLRIIPDPHASAVDVKPGILPNPVKDYTQPQSQSQTQSQTRSKSEQNTKPIVPVSTDLEVEQVDNEWDAEGNEYSTEDFLFDLKNLETKLREGLPDLLDPTLDPDYIVLKNYFIKHDLRERFRSLLSDPSRFYPEEGVYDNPQIKYARHAFRREKIDEDYIVALLSGTGAEYRARHKCSLYVDER